MKNYLVFSIALLGLLSGCIKDDFIDDMIDPELTITTIVDSLAIDNEFQLQSRYLNNIGQEEQVTVEWYSSDSDIIEIDSDGLAKGIAAGSSFLKVTYTEQDERLQDSILVHVGENTVITEQNISTTIVTTSYYLLEGTLGIEESNEGLELIIQEDYKASTALPGLYLYLSNNRNSISNALEVSKVTVFSGVHSYSVPNAAIGDYNFLVYYCKPFNIKVGEAVLN